MKLFKVIGLAAVLLALTIVPALAEFGTTVSSVTVQNTGTGDALVSFTFYDESGTAFSPDPLTTDGLQPNPFTLAPGESYELYMPNADLGDGRYSLVISADQPIVAVSNVVRDMAGTGYNGTFAGFSTGAAEIYLPSVVYDFYGYNSEISIQNTGTAATDITVDFSDGTQYLATSVAPNTSVFFDISSQAPSGMVAGAYSAVISASEPVAAVDNQYNMDGYLQTYNAFLSGATDWSVTALYNGFYGWVSSLDIQNIGSSAADITVSFSDGDTGSCEDVAPGAKCNLYMPAVKTLTSTLFAASVTADQPVVVVHNAANATAKLAQTSNGVEAGGATASIPAAYNNYYGWNSSWACVNMGASATDLTVTYDGFGSYTVSDLGAGESLEVYVPADADGPTIGNRAAVTVVSSATNIACTYNASQDQLLDAGDWAFAGNAFAE